MPDVVITCGPSGWTGYPDHSLVGAVVSEVFEAKIWGRHYNLYYPELLSGSLSSDLVFSTMDKSYLPVRI